MPLPEDADFMLQALNLAQKGIGWSSPNPAVGCLIVKNRQIVGRGHTQAFGGPHAEVVALKDASENAKGATAYVTLMPCAHYGKTPPCTEALLKHQVSRVVVALDDPNSTSKNGCDILRAAGISVEIGICQEEALTLLAGYLKRLHTGMPLVQFKYAMTLDGKIATKTGSSKWISNKAARTKVQLLRQQADAIMVGSGTLQKDNPRLNVRDPKQWQPKRIIIDSSGSTSPEAKIFHSPGGEIIIVTCSEKNHKKLAGLGAKVITTPAHSQGVDLRDALKKIAELGIQTILCEGGSKLAGSLFTEGLIDEVIAFIAPKICGGESALSPIAGAGIAEMSSAIKLENITFEKIEDNFCLRGRTGSWSWLKE